MFLYKPEPALVSKGDALPGRAEPVLTNPQPHAVLGTPITGPWKEGQKSLLIAIGCFWVLRKCTGKPRAWSPPPWATPAARPRTPPITKSAAA